MINSPAVIYVARWLIRDTFRQARSSGLLWVMLGLSGLLILVSLSVGVSGGAPLRQGDEPPEFLRHNDPQAARARDQGISVVSGELTIGFGVMRVPLGRDALDAVRFLQLTLAGGVADAAGLLLALVWTSGFLPAFLNRRTAAVLLAKPVPRWGLLLGKYFGVLAFVAFQAAIFVGGTWLALALRTGVWDSLYLWSGPLLVVHFAIFYSFSMMLAITTKSKVASIIGAIGFWLLCWGMNYGRHALVAMPDMGGFSASAQWLVEIGYWLLPKPADLGLLLFDALEAGNYFNQMFEFQVVKDKGAFHPEWSIISSLLFAVGVLAVTAREFTAEDY